MAKAISGVSYQELRSSRGNTIVISDPELPSPIEGRIYLFNTDRNAFVQYDASIVKDKLFPLDEAQRQEAEKKYQSAWETARRQLIRSNGKSVTTRKDKTEAIAEELLADLDETIIDDSIIDE